MNSLENVKTSHGNRETVILWSCNTRIEQLFTQKSRYPSNQIVTDIEEKLSNLDK